MWKISPKFLRGDEQREAERRVRQLEHEADLLLATDPNRAQLLLSECRDLRQKLPPMSLVHAWPQGQRELFPLKQP
jgi:hypothetical protein